MEHTRLGDTGLRISRLALGCMSYGDPTTEGAHRWALADDDAQPFFRQAIELGITFWDTANVYQAGTSEEVVGRAIRRYSRREDIVLATKVFGKMHNGPGGSGLSRKAIMEQIDASLTRLGTDYVDLYQIHRFDPATPVAETMGALHDIVKAGKVRYLGASSMYAWQFAKLQHAADQGGWTRFVSMQNQYNLLRRQDEPELMAMCADTGVGLVPYSPQGKGRLARPWDEQSTRSSVDHVVQAFDSPLRRRGRHARRALQQPRTVLVLTSTPSFACRRASARRPTLRRGPATELEPVNPTAEAPAQNSTGGVYVTRPTVAADRRLRPVHPRRPYQPALPRFGQILHCTGGCFGLSPDVCQVTLWMPASCCYQDKGYQQAVRPCASVDIDAPHRQRTAPARDVVEACPLNNHAEVTGLEQQRNGHWR